ncbi:MAG: EscU/YscU/HrcU family type III secretion system export apparatus switch protein [Beijerinckiaceae bacterium]|nr:EscU/YscU/HrcU family type III secretion system export apparatus switch protein [Beijerinckiaceae bacterium]
MTLDPHLAETARNPGEKIAVALKYDFGDGAPVVTAKGRGEVAEKILETAREHDVAIEQNPILAEALSRIELDTEIPVPLYKAVAEVIGFLLRTGQLNRPAAGEAPSSLTTHPDRR